MSQFCQDRDLLIIEPGAFTSGVFRGQVLAAGDDGILEGTEFASESADFAASSVQPGMVLCLHRGQVSEGTCCEIMTVDDAQTLTVSAPRADRGSAAAPPPSAGEGLNWQVLTLSPQIALASAGLAERLRTTVEAGGIRQGDFADSEQLRTVAAHAALAAVFASSAEGSEADDARWAKARHYAGLFQSGLPKLRLAFDADGDGLAEQTRSLGNVRLRRA